MAHDRVFESMDPAAKKFYSKVFNTALLNSYAVRNGLFDVRLCDSDDPRIMTRWRAAVPGIIAAMQIRGEVPNKNFPNPPDEPTDNPPEPA